MPISKKGDGRAQADAQFDDARFENLTRCARDRRLMSRLADLFYRLAYAAGFRCARLVWGLTRPRHEGALVAIMVGSRMLLLRQSYRRELSMPGGGIAAGEAPAAAACRELVEELDLAVPLERLHPMHTASGLWDGRHDTVTFFEIEFETAPKLRLDNREVVAAGLVPLDEIDASDVTPAVGAYLAWRRGCRGATA